MTAIELRPGDIPFSGLVQVPRVIFQPEKSIGTLTNFSHESTRRGLKYQELATREMTKVFPKETIVVTSEFLDHEIFRQTFCGNIGCAIPDLITVSDGVLGDLFEFKNFLNPKDTRNNRVDLRRKLRGFSLFLQVLRENPLLFTDTVDLLAGRRIFQEPILVKEDKDINVVFISSNSWFPKGEVLSARGSDLKGTFKTVPIPALAS